MGKFIVTDEQHYIDIADALREITGDYEDEFTPASMAPAIKGLINKNDYMKIEIYDPKHKKEQIATEFELQEHIDDKDNPHEVTKTQVGLGNVTNDPQLIRSERSAPGGVASLNLNGFVPFAQLKIASNTEVLNILQQFGLIPTSGVINGSGNWDNEVDSGGSYPGTGGGTDTPVTPPSGEGATTAILGVGLLGQMILGNKGE